MKISVIGLPSIPLGKHNLKDPRLDEVDSLVKAKKKTYVQVEVAGEDSCMDADVLLVNKDSLTDLVLKDLEFVETRLSKGTEAAESAVLQKLKGALEKEEFISNAGLTDDERKVISGYGFYTNKPVVAVPENETADLNPLLLRTVKEGGFISFFTAGEKETRAWLIKKGSSAWEASGSIHSDIQKGFIRAEIIPFADFIQCGGETQAKQAGKLTLQQKDYCMQDADLANFRFNK